MQGQTIREMRAAVPEGQRIYAIGDIHGRDDLLEPLLKAIEEDDAKRGPAEKQLIFLGDYIDRGPSSRQVVDRLVALQKSGAPVRFLCGNHEDILIDFIGPQLFGLNWLRNGGNMTLLSYGVDVTDYLGRDPATIQEGLREAFLAVLPNSHLDFYLGLEEGFAVGGYYFAHAGVRPGVPLDRQHRHDLVWIRHEFLESDEDFGAVIVHGHTPVKRPQIRPNRIGIDTKAWKTGRLTALGLEGEEHWFLTTDPEGGVVLV